MFKHKLLLLTFAAAILNLAAVLQANAGDSGFHETYLTFNTPFALPGVSLPAGTYMFEVVDTPGARNVIRVRRMDRTNVYLTAFTLTVPRPKGLPNDRQISFAEVRPGIVAPVKAWYPSTGAVGHQFIYPKDSPRLATRATN
jgi:hypothetical protein